MFNKYIKNVLMNSIPLVPFLIGTLYMIPGFQTFGIGMYWIIAVVGIFISFASDSYWKQVMEFHPDETEEVTNGAFDWNYQIFNYIWDMSVVMMLAYFGFGYLAIAYLLHIVGYYYTFDQIRQIVARDYQKDQEGHGEEA